MLEHSSPEESLATLLERFGERGFLIFPSLLGSDSLDTLRRELSPYLRGEYPGRNDFEGLSSQRVYAVLAKAPSAASLVAHPLSLQLAEAVLGPNFLLSACLAIQLEPGETAQAVHYDDAFLQIERPRPAYSMSTFWALDACDARNGATEIIPASHKWGSLQLADDQVIDRVALPGSDRDPLAQHPELVAAERPAGSLMIASGLLWHRGGANRSDGPRLLLTPQYCTAWARPQESFLLSIPQEIVAEYPKRVRELLGYSIHPPFMGHVGGRHPEKLLALE